MFNGIVSLAAIIVISEHTMADFEFFSGDSIQRWPGLLPYLKKKRGTPSIGQGTPPTEGAGRIPVILWYYKCRHFRELSRFNLDGIDSRGERAYRKTNSAYSGSLLIVDLR